MTQSFSAQPLVHMMWYQGFANAPPHVQDDAARNTKLWQQLGFRVVHWDNSSVQQLIQSSYADLIPWFSGIQKLITACDVARAIVLDFYGGLYADVDFEPNQRIREFYERGVESKKVLFIGDPRFGANNYLIYSPKAALFWKDAYLPYVKDALKNPSLFDILLAAPLETWPVLSSSGPIASFRLLQAYPDLAARTAASTDSRFGKQVNRSGIPTWFHSSVMKRLWISLAVVVFAVFGVCALVNSLFKGLFKVIF